YLFIPATHPLLPNRMEPVLTPGWTLNYEMFFYLLFGLCLLVPRRRRHLTVVGVIGLIASLRAFHFPYPSVPAFYCSSIILEFAAGVILGYLITCGIVLPLRASVLLLIGGVLGLIAMSVFVNSWLPRALMWGVPATAIVGGAVFYERAHAVPDLSVPRLLGDASYSIYLSHPILLSAFSQLWRKAGFSALSYAHPLFVVLSVVLAAMGGVTVYRFVELPLSRAFSRKRSALAVQAGSEHVALVVHEGPPLRM
ncbi:MAG: acyltransferase, partial [Alphaproteobacteria bacterium]|nr:acyltransferase [Alphaproteobacteria bacterium]